MKIIFKSTIILTLYWWCLYIIVMWADTDAANFVGIICGMLGLAFAIWYAIYIYEGDYDKMEEMRRTLACGDYQDFMDARKQLVQAEMTGKNEHKIKMTKSGYGNWRVSKEEEIVDG